MAAIRALTAQHGELTFVDVDNALEPMQRFVGGYIEVLGLGNGLLLICDEEANLKRSPPPVTAIVGATPIRGPFLICRQKGAEFASANEEDRAAVARLVTPVEGE